MAFCPTDPLFLIDTLDQVQDQVRITRFEHWIPFGVSGPRPMMRGLWSVMRPGVQALLVQAFACEGMPPTVPVLRPTALRVLAGSYEARLEEPMLKGTSTLQYAVTSRTKCELLAVPGTRYGVQPIEPCIPLVVRLAPVPRSGSPVVPHQVFRPGPEHVELLRKQALALLAS